MKLFLTTLSLCVAITSYGQLEARRFFISGSAIFNKTHYDNWALISWQAGGSIRGGYMLKENFAIGAGLRYMDFKTEGYSGPTRTLTSAQRSKAYGGSIFARRFLSANEKFHFFIDGEFFSQRDENYEWAMGVPSDSISSNRIGAAVAPGVVFFITKKIALTSTFGQLSYYHINQPGIEKKYYDFDVNFNIRSVMFGASIFF